MMTFDFFVAQRCLVFRNINNFIIRDLLYAVDHNTTPPARIPSEHQNALPTVISYCEHIFEPKLSDGCYETAINRLLYFIRYLME
jgi:hypothetical protein